MMNSWGRWKVVCGVAAVVAVASAGMPAAAAPRYPRMTASAFAPMLEEAEIESQPGPAGASPAAETAMPADEEESLRVSMDFQDADLKDVLKVFSKQTGINVIAREDVGQRTITLYLDDVTVLDALDQILTAADLIYERSPGSQIYLVKPKPDAAAVEARSMLETRIYRLKYARVSESHLSKAAEVLMRQTPFEARPLVSVTGTGGASSSAPTGGAGGGTQEGVGIDQIIEELLTDQGRVSVDGRTNSVVITDVPENFPRLEAALAALDVRTPQVLIEAEMLETTLQKAKDLGLKWGTSGTILKLTPAKRATKFPFVFGDVEENIASASTTGTGAISFVRSGQLALGTLDASQANIVLNALEEDTDTKILARPRVLTLDNESAVIRMTSSQSIASEVTQTDIGAGVQTTSTERATTGVILVVTPQVNEHDYVTMLVEPTVSRTVVSEINPALLDPKSRSVRTMVRIRSGDTLVLGGLVDSSDKDILSRVPIMSGIPLLGEAFKHTSKKDTSTELIVFITPRVLPEAMPQVADASRRPLGLREQEELSSRQSAMEESMQRLEQSP